MRAVHISMMTRIQMLLVGPLLVSAAGTAFAEQAPLASPPEPCAPSGKPPAAGTPPAPSDNPSDRLAGSKGVICPPIVDPDIRVKPPSNDGTIKVIPAPGTPGGDPDAQPK